MKILRIHHVTLAVRDLDRARETFAALFGVASEHGDVIEAFGVRTADVALGGGTLQLAAALDGESPIARFTERRGEGFYNIALEVDDLDAAVAELGERGVRVSEPVEATPGIRSAFITMSATHGLSVQLMQIAATQSDVAAEASTPLGHDEPPETWESENAPESGDASSQRPLLDLTPDEWSDTD